MSKTDNPKHNNGRPIYPGGAKWNKLTTLGTSDVPGYLCPEWSPNLETQNLFYTSWPITSEGDHKGLPVINENAFSLYYKMTMRILNKTLRTFKIVRKYFFKINNKNYYNFLKYSKNFPWSPLLSVFAIWLAAVAFPSWPWVRCYRITWWIVRVITLYLASARSQYTHFTLARWMDVPPRYILLHR